MHNKFFKTGWLVVCLFGIAACGLQAQNIKRGFKSLEKVDYEKSYDLFNSALSENKDNPAALLGLTFILADDSSNYFDLIGAWKHANLLKPLLEKFTTEELEFIGEYFYNTEARHISRPVKKKIEYAIETVEAKLIKYIREENNLEIAYTVLKEFPEFRYYDNVLHIRNQLEFRKYEKQNTLDAYLEFIQKFPDAAQIDKAIRYRNRLAFERASQINTAESYEAFMDQYPDALEISLAIRKLHFVAFEEAKKANNIQAFDRFISAYPDALEISEAKIIQKQLLYEYAKKIQTLEAYNEFIRKYPDGQQYIDIFNLKAMENGMRFIAQHTFPTQNIEWARSFEEEELTEINACIAIDTLNAYVLAATVLRTDTGYTDCWILKVNAEGKMLWNKYIGEGFNDEIALLSIDSKNEIIGAGYTWSGIDSASRETWIFKIGEDGSKLWSKKMGQLFINDMMTSSSGNIFLGGYVVNDSLQRLYSVVVLNEHGKRLWGRTYTGRGEVVQIVEFPDHKLLIAGNHWCARIDSRGYLAWESSFNNTDSIISAHILSKGEVFYLGLRNKSTLVVSRTNADNKTLVEKNIPLPGLQPEINAVIAGGINQVIALISFDDYQSIYWFNTITGELVSTARLPGGAKFSNLITDQKNNLLMLAGHSEILLVKNQGLNF